MQAGFKNEGSKKEFPHLIAFIQGPVAFLLRLIAERKNLQFPVASFEYECSQQDSFRNREQNYQFENRRHVQESRYSKTFC